MTWNIHHGADVTNRLDLAAVAAVIARIEPDVVALQELDRNWGERSDDADQPGWLAETLDMHCAFGANVVRQRAGQSPQEYGIALLGREPWSGVSHELFPARGRLEPRGYLTATTSATHVRVCCTHLSAGSKASAGPAREHQAAHLIDRLTGQSPLPLLAGDFNAAGLARPLLAMRRHWIDAAWQSARGRTSTLVGPSPRRLDYVWVDPAWSIEQAVVIDTALSDHRPVVVDVRRPAVSDSSGATHART